MANDISKIKTPDGVVHDLKALSVKDSYNGAATTFAYSKAALTSTTWLAAWNGYELRGILPANITAGRASALYGPVGQAVTATAGDRTLAFYPRVSRSTAGLFPANDNANAIITFNRHDGDYYSQLGFSSNKDIYYRSFAGSAIDTTAAWDVLATSRNIGTVYRKNGEVWLVSTLDYQRVVIGLVQIGTSNGTMDRSNSFDGTIIGRRSNALHAQIRADVTISTSYYKYAAFASLSTNYENADRTSANTGNGYRLCTFTYNEKVYAGVEVYSTSALSYYYKGTYTPDSTVEPFAVAYYTQNNSSVINSEIYNSISFVSARNVLPNFTAPTLVLDKATVIGDVEFWSKADGATCVVRPLMGGNAYLGSSAYPWTCVYSTNLSANKVTAGELYGDSIKAALGDYNGVVTYNADTGALDVNTTAAFDAWGKTSGGGIYTPTIQTTPSATSGTVVLVSGNSASNQNGGHLVSDESGAGDTNLIVHSDLSTSMPSATAAGGTTYKLAANNAFNKTPSLNATYAVPIFSNFLYRTTADGSATPRKPSSVTFDSSNIINLAFSASLNPSASASSLKFGVTTGDNNSGAITAGLGIYSKGQIALTNGLFIYNTGGYSSVSGKTIYNSGMASSIHGIRVINDGGQAAIVVGESIVNKVHLATLFGQGHDTTGASQAVCAVGKYSLITSTTAFVVGNGTSVSARSNAFEVLTDGSVKAKGAITVNGTAVSLNGHTHSYLPLSGGALTGDVTLATGKTIRPAAATNACSLGTSSYKWNNAHVNNLTVYSSLSLPFLSSGVLTYDTDSGEVDALAFGASTAGYLRADGIWSTPGGTNAGHTHTLKITTVQGTNVTYLQSNTTYKLVVGNASYQFKTPTDYTCLAEGTKILMADNSEKNIEDVAAGDIIMSYDPNTEKLCEAVIIDNIHTGRSDDYVNYYFDDGSFLSIFGKHCIYSADEGTARGVDYWEPGWKTISANGKEVMYIGSENIHNAGRKRHFDLHSSNKLYFANGILNAQSLTLDYPLYKDDGLPEEYITALKADFDSSASLHTHQFDKKTGAVLVPILKELKAQKKVMDDNKKRLADSDYLVAKFTEGLISAAEWLKAKAERAGWRSAVNKAEPLYAAAEERYAAFKAKYKAPNTKRERFNAAVARDNACLDALKAYYKSKNELSK